MRRDTFMSAWRVASAQGSGVAAQVAFGAPSIAASLVLARFDNLHLVADLALAFGLVSTVFTAASFNLSQYLALWGLRQYTAGTLWRNRSVAVVLASVVAGGVLGGMGAAPAMIALAVLIKGTDAFAELRLGLTVHEAGSAVAMRELLRWSVARLTVMMTVGGAALASGVTGRHALLAGAVAQAMVCLPWRSLTGALSGVERWRVAYDLARETWPLSVAATTCGILTTAPRILAERIEPSDELGYYGIVFMASTFIGMSFNVAWYRLAALFLEHGRRRAVHRYLRDGSLLTVALFLGVLLGTPLIARIYGITDPRFGQLFPSTVGLLVLFYFSMSLANLLKTSRLRFFEAGTYMVGALVLAGVGLALSSVALGILTATIALLLMTFLGLRAPEAVRE